MPPTEETYSYYFPQQTGNHYGSNVHNYQQFSEKQPIMTYCTKNKKTSNTPLNVEPYNMQHPSIVRRNARERSRVKKVNDGFEILLNHIPVAHPECNNKNRKANKKTSKVNTLKMAMEYIQNLQELLETCNSSWDSRSSTSNYKNSAGLSCEMSVSSGYEEEVSSPSISYAGNSSCCAMPRSNFEFQLGSEEENCIKFQTCDEYGSVFPRQSFEDEELLDYISLWEEQ